MRLTISRIGRHSCRRHAMSSKASVDGHSRGHRSLIAWMTYTRFCMFPFQPSDWFCLHPVDISSVSNHGDTTRKLSTYHRFRVALIKLFDRFFRRCATHLMWTRFPAKSPSASSLFLSSTKTQKRSTLYNIFLSPAFFGERKICATKMAS